MNTDNDHSLPWIYEPTTRKFTDDAPPPTLREVRERMARERRRRETAKLAKEALERKAMAKRRSR